MDGSFNYMQNLGKRLAADVRARRGASNSLDEFNDRKNAEEIARTQPAHEDIANALQILSDIDGGASLGRVRELLNSALTKLTNPMCIICERRVEKDVIADDGVCFECRNPECEPGEQMVLTPLQRGVLRVIRGYGDSTITQIHNRVNPIHDTALETQVASAVVDLITAKCLIKIGRWHYRLTEVGRNAIGR